MLRLKRPRFLLSLLSGVCLTASVFAAPSTPAVFNILDTAVASHVEPLGANVGTVMGGTNYTTNQFMRGTGFEPGYDRWLRRIDSCGTNWFTWTSFGGVSEWELDSTGFGNGASVRVYRIVNSSGQPLAWATGGAMEDATGADHVVFVGEYHIPMPGGALPKGGWIADGGTGAGPFVNRVYLDSNVTLYRGDYMFMTFRKVQLVKSEINGRLYQYNANIESVGHLTRPTAWNAKLVAHPTPVPQAMLDEDPGETCLEIDPTDATTSSLGQYLFHAFDQGEGQWYGTLTPGAHYRCDVWLRQVGLGNGGHVRFCSNQSYSAISQTFNVPGTWQKFSYEFNGPNYPNTDAWHQMFALEITGPGQLWVDNWAVYQDDAVHEMRPFSPCSTGYNEYLRTIPPSGPKPSARFYPATFPSTAPMSRLLSNWAGSNIDFIYNLQPGIQITIPHCLYWCFKSGNSPETRIVPYFTLRVEDMEADWKALVEYLGVPYDSTVDSPASKPWAYMRFKQRGIGTPWTDEFREIIIEYGNESWHNGAGGYGWYGFSRASWVWAGGTEYGLFAHYMFDQQVGGMPWWTQYNLGSKIKFALNGGYMIGTTPQYGDNSVRLTTGAVKYVTHANYVGPKWETGDTPDSIFNDDGMQRTLVAADPDFKANYLAMHAKYRDDAKALGVNYNLIVYEGGPSGYTVGGGSATVKEVSEEYGKSMGMAVAAMDSWLYSSYVGYKFQNYLGYGCGTGWSSHTQVPQGGFRQHCGWMAMALRNNYARGDRMLRTNFTTVPTYQDTVVCDSAIPLVAVYALANTQKSLYSVFVLSRKLAGTHNNATNFGDGFSPVTLNLPFTQRPQAIYLYRLARRDGSWTDATLNNRDSLRVVIRCDTINPANWAQAFVLNASTGADARGLPPANIFMYLFALDTTAISVQGADLVGMFARASQEQGPAVTPQGLRFGQASQPGASAQTASAAERALYPKVVGPQVVSGTMGSPTLSYIADEPATSALMQKNAEPVAVAPRLAAPGGQVQPVAEPQARSTGAPLPQSLAVTSVSASSFSRGHRPINTLDRSAATRWTPSAGGYQWIAYDLGQVKDVAAAAGVWYRRDKASASVVVTTSTDGVNWALAWRGLLEGRGTQRMTCSFASRQARYVRVSVDSGEPVSFAEVGIYAQAQDAVALK
jgi:hypothetical protein